MEARQNEYRMTLRGEKDFSAFFTFDDGIVDIEGSTDQGTVTTIKGPPVSVSD